MTETAQFKKELQGITPARLSRDNELMIGVQELIGVAAGLRSSLSCFN